ncbi:Quaternary ammonium compound-resistance protein SugE [compost metagenome]
MAWVYVFAGGIMDVGWAIGLKYTDGFTNLVPSIFTLLCIVISFYLFAKAMKALPVSIAYAVFTGTGAAGTVICGMIFLDEPSGALRILFIGLLLFGILGLQMASSSKEKQESAALTKEDQS